MAKRNKVIAKKNKEYPLVIVRWEDITTHYEATNKPEDYDCFIMQTCGFLYSKGKHIKIVGTFCESDNSFADVTVIPASCVLHITTLDKKIFIKDK